MAWWFGLWGERNVLGRGEAVTSRCTPTVRLNGEPGGWSLCTVLYLILSATLLYTLLTCLAVIMSYTKHSLPVLLIYLSCRASHLTLWHVSSAAQEGPDAKIRLYSCDVMNHFKHQLCGCERDSSQPYGGVWDSRCRVSLLLASLAHWALSKSLLFKQQLA